ncbi:ribonuclease TUDOR 1-like [Phragmites australis]|uniref:ribonuclease TUDOR 1-like n=1 Tax=Phragmites australis TaxID=29695 RepID=UPI002D79ED39|nr:ribonuclease TUDOR 1-like [Phragmites australis]
MASNTGASGWLSGKVKAVTSGDCLLIMGSTNVEIPPEKSITLSYLMAPRLARRDGVDEPFAWESREFLRKLCIGKEVTFRVDYTAPDIGREFGTVYLGDKNVAYSVVSAGWARVKEQGPKGGEQSPYLSELLRLEEVAKQQGLGRWSKEPGAAEESIRDLPPAIGEASSFDAKGFAVANKGKSLEAIVEQVRDGSTVRVYLLPSFQFVQIYVAGVQAPSMGRCSSVPTVVAETDGTADGANGEDSEGTPAQLTTAQRLVASAASTEVPPDRFGREAKQFTETRVLNRDVRIVVEGTDSFSNIIGSVHYPDGETAKDLALELVENGLAKYVEWSANMLDVEVKIKLKNAELQAKNDQLRIWTGFKPPVTNSEPIHDQKFTGKVVEIVSGDCIIVADDAAPYGSPSAKGCRPLHPTMFEPDLRPPEHQVAGHRASANKLGPLVDSSGLFYKPLQTGDRGEHELAFYEAFSAHPAVPPRIRDAFFPRFHGTRLLPTAARPGESHPHIVIEDLLVGLAAPSVIDIKIGACTWPPCSPEPYVTKCLAKDRETTSSLLGFRISGVRVVGPRDIVWRPEQPELKALDTAGVRRMLRRYVSSVADEGLDHVLVAAVYNGEGGVLSQLRQLKAWFEEQTLFHFYSASILLCYDANVVSAIKGGGVRVKLVDFAHVVDGDGVIDHNFLGGLCSLIKFISDIVAES